MGQKWPSINTFVRKLIAKQHVFFVATAPLSADGHINVSPKGHCAQTFSIINDNLVAFLDLTGSGVETIAHVKENGRIVFMFCSFDESPCIIRLWGKASVHERGTSAFNELLPRAFPDLELHTSNNEPKSGSVSADNLGYEHPGYAAGVRSIILCNVSEVATACGYAVPLMQYQSDRDSLLAWTASKGRDGVEQYMVEKNGTSIDGLKAVDTAFVASAKYKGSISPLESCIRMGCTEWLHARVAQLPNAHLVAFSTGIALGFLLAVFAAKHV